MMFDHFFSGDDIDMMVDGRMRAKRKENGALIGVDSQRGVERIV
ncbi:MAG: hypothetical protein WCK85_04390 [Chlorobium sp.]